MVLGRTLLLMSVSLLRAIPTDVESLDGSLIPGDSSSPLSKVMDESDNEPGSCQSAMAASETAYEEAARVLGVKGLSFAVHERQPLWRQMVARTVAPPAARTTRDTIYWIEPKSAHSTIVNHLLKGDGFEGSETRWDASHHEATASELIRLGPKPSAAQELARSRGGSGNASLGRPFEWTVVREPLGHFVAGFDEVEFFYQTVHPLQQNSSDPAWRQSGWMAARDAGEAVPERAAAMVADLLAQRGPQSYLDELVHITPQSLGFARSVPSSEDELGSGFAQLDFVGHMEELDLAWENVRTRLGLQSQAAHVDSHVNPQVVRRQKDDHDIHVLMDHQPPTATGSPPAVDGSTKDAAESKAAAALATALCTLLEREYACLAAYTAPLRCTQE